MVFRATGQEVAAVLEVDASHLPKVGCSGITSSLDSLEAGMLFVAESTDSKLLLEAFSKGASFLLAPEGELELDDEVKAHTLQVSNLSEAFWSLFSWWREKQDVPFATLLGDQSFKTYLQEVGAQFLLSKKKGFYRGARFEDERLLASEVMNSEEETGWYLVSLTSQMERLFQGLKPSVVTVDFESGGSHSEKYASLLSSLSDCTLLSWKGEQKDLPSEISEKIIKPEDDAALSYLRNGKVAYLSKSLSFSGWPLPLLPATEIVVLVIALAHELGVSFSENEVVEVAGRFFPPPHLGFSLLLGESGSIWIERTLDPSESQLGALLTEIGEDKVAVYIDQTKDSDLLSHLPGGIPVFVREEGEKKSSGVVSVSGLHQAVDALLHTTPFFLLAFVSDEGRADLLFHQRDEFYNLANSDDREVHES